MKKVHLTQQERYHIEDGLNKRASIASISRELGKNRSTIAREIKSRAVSSTRVGQWQVHNACVHRKDCDLQSVCPNNPNCTHKSPCRRCKFCNSVCVHFEEEPCPLLASPPYVCNGCGTQNKCTLNRKYYQSADAQNGYKRLWSESRSGVNLTEEELLALDELITPGLEKGQSLYHIVAAHGNDLPVCERTLYNYVDGGLFKARNIDMPRKVGMKPRKTKCVEHKVDSACRIGRTWEDLKAYTAENPSIPIAEMDSVIGRIGGKFLLTIQLVQFKFQFAFLRDRNTAASVAEKIDDLYDRFGHELFIRILPLLIADNGSEFSDPSPIEVGKNGTTRTRVFYCHPYSSFEKPHVENNHGLIRRILPKGTSFDDLTQADINLVMSHVNSYAREELYGRVPMTLFADAFGWDILYHLGLQWIQPQEIVLRPSLLKCSGEGGAF